MLLGRNTPAPTLTTVGNLRKSTCGRSSKKGATGESTTSSTERSSCCATSALARVVARRRCPSPRLSCVYIRMRASATELTLRGPGKGRRLVPETAEDRLDHRHGARRAIDAEDVAGHLARQVKDGLAIRAPGLRPEEVQRRRVPGEIVEHQREDVRRLHGPIGDE